MRFKITTIFCACFLGCVGIIPKNNPTVVFDDGNHFGLLSKSLITDHDSYFFFQLAEHLHKSVDEIMELTSLEVEGWAAYFEIKNDRMKNAKH